MPISSGLNSDLIRVGIILPEDGINAVDLGLSAGMLSSLSDETISENLSFHVALDDQHLLVTTPDAEFRVKSLTLRCSDAVEDLKPGFGMGIDSVVAGRGFHWEKKIHVDLPGEIQITAVDNGLKLINTLNIEAYVACVATSEMGAEAPADLLAAQTVVARCWSLALAEAKHLDAGFDVCNDDCCQRFQGTSFLTPHSLKAAIDTKGEVLIYDERVIDARYSKNCGGMVEDYDTVWSGGPVPYLIPLWDGPTPLDGMAVDDLDRLWNYDEAYCASTRFKNVNLAGMLGKVDVSGSYYRWEKSIPKSQLLANLKKYHDLEWSEVTGIRIGERGPSGRIKFLYLEGLSVSGSAVEQRIQSEYGIRQMFSESFLFSSAFRVLNPEHIRRSDHITLRGMGWGHGVGLCQMGALGMALAGIPYQEILRHYYPGTTFTKLP